jgi:branched-chain amino acid transport system ATP-binding protein
MNRWKDSRRSSEGSGQGDQDLVCTGEFAVIIVEQHARAALALTTQAIVLDRGRVVHQASSEDLLADTAVLDRLVALA